MKKSGFVLIAAGTAVGLLLALSLRHNFAPVEIKQVIQEGGPAEPIAEPTVPNLEQDQPMTMTEGLPVHKN